MNRFPSHASVRVVAADVCLVSCRYRGGDSCELGVRFSGEVYVAHRDLAASSWRVASDEECGGENDKREEFHNFSFMVGLLELRGTMALPPAAAGVGAATGSR